MSAIQRASTHAHAPRARMRGEIPPGASGVLAPEAVGFVALLSREFGPRVEALLEARRERRARALAEGAGLLADTAAVRAAGWRVAALPPALAALSGSAGAVTVAACDGEALARALSSGGIVVADLGDGAPPLWRSQLDGLRRVGEFARGTLAGFVAGESAEPPVLLVRPRGLHLTEKRLEVDGAPVCAAIADVGLLLAHAAWGLLGKGQGPRLSLAKLDGHREARLWCEMLAFAESKLGLPHACIGVEARIETAGAALEMDEVLFELRERAIGLSLSRAGLAASLARTLGARAEALLPDGGGAGAKDGFAAAAARVLGEVCARRGALAIDGAAAPEGAEPAGAASGRHLRCEGEAVTEGEVTPRERASDAAALLRVPAGPRTEEGLGRAVHEGVRALEAWLRGEHGIAADGSRDHARRFELARAIVWQRAASSERSRASLLGIFDAEMRAIAGEVGPDAFEGGRYEEARDLLLQLALAPGCDDEAVASACGLLMG